MEIKIENVENLIGFFYGGALLIALIAPKSVYSPLYLLIMTLIYIFLYLERRMSYFEGPDIKPVYKKKYKKMDLETVYSFLLCDEMCMFLFNLEHYNNNRIYNIVFTNHWNGIVCYLSYYYAVRLFKNKKGR